MKKYFSIFFFISFLMIFLVGCVNKDAENFKETGEYQKFQDVYFASNLPIDSSISIYTFECKLPTNFYNPDEDLYETLEDIQLWFSSNNNIDIKSLIPNYDDNFYLISFTVVFKESNTSHDYHIVLSKSNFNFNKYISALHIGSEDTAYYLVLYDKITNIEENQVNNENENE